MVLPRAIRAAMRLNPFYPVNYLAALADAMVHQDRRSEALDVLGTIVKRNPNYLSAHLHLAGTPRACRRLGEGKGCRSGGIEDQPGLSFNRRPAVLPVL